MSQDFGVGFADQVVPAVCQELSERLIILDDAVVDHGDATCASSMRMRIHVARGSVRGPPGVSDAHRSHGLVFAHVTLQVGDFPLLFFNAQARSFFEGGHSCAVVAAVFEPLEAVNQDGVRGLRSEVSYNATHERLVGVGLKAKSQFQTGGVVDAGAVEFHT